MSSEFYKAPKNLMSATGFVSKSTGEPVDLTAVDKLVLIYMYARTTYFNNSGGGHYETQVTIGNAIGLEWKAVARSLKKMYDGGVLDADKPRSNGNKSWVYKSVNLDINFFGTKRIQKEVNIVVDKVVEPSIIEPQANDIEYCEYDDEFLQSVRFRDE